jgi:hypothetical protein
MVMMSGKENPILAEYLPGKEDVIAVCLSRVFSDHTEWSLRQEILDHLRKIIPFSSRSRLVRFADKQQDPEVRLLAPRPIGMVSACSLISMDRNESIHVSIVLPRRKSATKNPQRPGGSFAPDSVTMDNTAWFADLLHMLIKSQA